MDEVAKYNVERWQALADAGAIFTRPRLDLDQASAQSFVDSRGLLGEVAGRDVLCLAGGGGQQSAAFALLGAKVTVVDLSEAQLQRDAEVAAHFNLQIERYQGDMRDLSRFDENSFDIVYQPYSLNFVPDARVVFREVARILRPGGIYHFMCANPFLMGLGEKDWSGDGYALKRPYINGAEITYPDESWVYGGGEGENPVNPIRECREYRQTLGTLINGLIEQGFLILNISEQNLGTPDIEAEPGTSDHLTAIAPPWLLFWSTFRPDVLKG